MATGSKAPDFLIQMSGHLAQDKNLHAIDKDVHSYCLSLYTDKQNVVYVCKGILFSREQEGRPGQ